MCPNSPSFGFDSRPRRCNLNADKHFHIAGKVSIMGLLNHDRIPIMTVSYAHIIMQLHSAPRGAVVHIGGEMTPK